MFIQSLNWFHQANIKTILYLKSASISPYHHRQPMHPGDQQSGRRKPKLQPCPCRASGDKPGHPVQTATGRTTGGAGGRVGCASASATSARPSGDLQPVAGPSLMT